MSHTILGEGTYGCAIKPSLKCKGKKTSKIYENKVSKVMRDWDAEKELKEMEFINNIKGIEKYAVNLPIMCKPDMKDPNFDEYVSKCDTYYVAESYENNPKELSLLLLDDGNKILLGKEIYKYFKPKQVSLIKDATNNDEPESFILNSSFGNNIASDTFSFYDMDSNDLTAKGDGGTRQMHTYASINFSDKIE